MNENQGMVSIAIFLITILLGWISGIFSALRRRPKFTIRLIPGPSFCSTFPTGKKHGDFDAHRTAIALYLTITNTGSASSSISDIHLGYHWSLLPRSFLWLRYGLGWFWIRHQAIALSDFQVAIGEHTKMYPFLTQRSHISGESAKTFLEIGESSNGVAYFEQFESWGGCFPRENGGKTRIKIRVFDVFGKRHSAKFWVDVVSLEHARQYNPTFGMTLSELESAKNQSYDVPPDIDA